MTNLERLAQTLRTALSEYRAGSDRQEESVLWVARALSGAGVIVPTKKGPWQARYEAERESRRYTLVRTVGDRTIPYGYFETEAEALIAAGALNALLDLGQ